MTKKGYEDPWRKHHTSSITRDIWLCSLNGNRTFRKQTAFNGEDRTPVWASDDKSFYYLSEEKKAHLIFSNVILTVIHPNKLPTIPNIRYAS